MSFLAPTDRAALEQDPQKAGEAMESMLLQRMLASCHLMGKSSAPGSDMRSELFVETLADAVTKSGGMGLAKELVAASTKTPAGEESSPTQKNISQLNPSTSGTDLETELLSHRTPLIGNAKQADNSLGEP